MAAVTHTTPRGGGILLPKSTLIVGTDNEAIVASTVWTGPWAFGVAMVKYLTTPASVIVTLDLLPGGVSEDAVQLYTSTNTIAFRLIGPAEGLRGLLFRAEDTLRLTINGGGAGVFAKGWIYSGNIGM